jgi:diguanylate cyclase
MSYISDNIEKHEGYRSGNLLGWLLGRGEGNATPNAERGELSRHERFNMRHGQLLQQICDFLTRAGLDPIPDHYELAWLYIAGSSFSQRHMIEAHMLDHGGISSTHASELLDKLRTVISERELSQMVEAAKTDILEARATTDKSGREAADFGLALGDTAPDLGDPAKAIATVQKLQQLTANMVDRAARAEAELKSRSKAMSQLRGRLAQSQKQAMSDALTDLPNRRAFDIQLEQAIETAHSKKAPLSVAFCDIDHFKRVNDTHGHATGDRVIRHVAQILKSCAGAKAHVARHGGAVLACDLLNQARARLDAKRLVARDSNQPIGEITISCGVATLQPGETTTNLLARADQALYEAKNSGRNRIIVSSVG